MANDAIPPSRKEFLAFFLCGASAAMINLVSRWALTLFLPYVAAITIAYLLGLLSGYIFFKHFAFRAETGRKKWQEWFWYILVNAYGLGQTILLSLLFAQYIFPWMGMTYYPEDLAHIIGLCPSIFTSYLGHKYLTFRIN